MNADLIVLTVGVLAALVLAVRGIRNRRETPQRLLLMAVAWVVIIIAVMFVLHSFGLPR